ncbi:hypothetical protein SADUNF_Sadunf14G0113300 [Salix dunnii]|uniref:Uncharacterized protein n=1 Tax=Salix dunnii TaxID=1413687 RepID=A0A835JJF5_9ROSI|nr:hypothetical protein SADUNF_Sadunf14G0113300 [Salix dunnii]
MDNWKIKIVDEGNAFKTFIEQSGTGNSSRAYKHGCSMLPTHSSQYRKDSELGSIRSTARILDHINSRAGSCNFNNDGYLPCYLIIAERMLEKTPETE